MDFKKSEIEKIIKKETQYIERRKKDIEAVKADIEATRKTIAFWKGELKKAN